MAADPTFYILKAPHFPPAKATPLLLGPLNVSAYISTKTDARLSAEFKDVAKICAHRNSSASNAFETSRIRSVRVTSRGKVFKKLMDDKNVINEVKSFLSIGGTAYIIVGVCIWENAIVEQREMTAQGAEASVTVPAGTAAAAMGGVPPRWMNNLGDLRLDARFEEEASRTIQAETEGSSIFAIECRQVFRYPINIFKRAPLVIYDSSPRYDRARTLGNNHKKEPAEASSQEQEDEIQADFEEVLPWTRKAKKIKVIKATGCAFAFDE